LGLLLASWEGPGKVDTDLRVSLVAAAAAVALSALVGALSGVSFGALAARALVAGIVFGGLAYGALYLARRFFPGLSPGGDEPADQGEEGHEVDIVLPGEGPESLFGRSPGEGPEAASDAEDVEPIGVSSAVADAAGAEAADAGTPIVAGLGRAPADPRAAARTSPGPGVREARHEVVEESAEIGSLLGPEEEEGGGVAALPSGPSSSGSAAFDDLDVLPDLDGFSDSFAAGEISDIAGTGDAASSSLAPPVARGPAAPRGGGSGSRAESLDPASLAQAVRTILKRDQKG